MVSFQGWRTCQACSAARSPSGVQTPAGLETPTPLEADPSPYAAYDEAAPGTQHPRRSLAKGKRCATIGSSLRQGQRAQQQLVSRMPDVREAVAAPGRALSGATLGWVGVRALPWLLVLGVAALALLHTGTPALDIGRYAIYWCFGVTLPGLLVARATVGTRGNWPEDVAIGAVTGLALEIACFALWSILGLQQQLWLWPLVVVVTFVAVPRLRRHWRISSPQPLPQLWSWGMASAIAACILIVRERAFAAPLPPAGGIYDQDVTWHLSIVHELTRSFPPQIPQVAGEVLRYHWFSHIHMAAAHLVSGAPEATVVLRLWIIPLLAVTALVGARLAMELSGRWWSGPIAAWGLIVFTGTSLLPVAGDAGVIFPTSPSQVYVLPLVLGVTTLIVRALRGVRLGAGWSVLALVLVAAAGAKPTAMPLVLAGTCLAGLSLLVQRRRQWLAALSVAAIVVVILPVSVLAVSGSESGSTISLFDFVEWQPIYHSLTGAGIHPSVGPILPEGVSDLSRRSLIILAILLLVPLVQNVGRLAPFASLGSKRLRKDPAAWFMAGVIIAGWVVYLALSHPAYSQAYFLRLANPVASVFGAWALAAAVPSTVRAGRRAAAVLAGGTLMGAGVVALGRAVTPTLPGDTGDLTAVEASFVAPLALVGVAIIGSLLAWALVRRKIPGLRGWGTALALAALVLGGPAEGTIHGFDRDDIAHVAAKPVGNGVSAAPRINDYRLSPGAGAAMAWIDQHTANDAVIATNRHCVIGPQRPRCLSMAFWVSGLGGRRTVLEGWGYTSAAKTVAAPSPFPERLAVNDAVFTHPSTTTIKRLRQRYGATWLVADTSAGPVSPQLARFAVPRFSSGEITVYELP